MDKTFKGPAMRVGSLFQNIDYNTIEMLNVILRFAYHDHTLKDFADPGNEPASPAANDCYLVSENGTIWGMAVTKNQILKWNGAAWDVLDYKITEIGDNFSVIIGDDFPLIVNDSFKNIYVLTQAEYDALTPDEDTVYLIKETE
jgi:hypothetical protein